MSYLSQIRVGKGEAARLRLQDAYSWHQELWRAFPGKDGELRSFLFRVEDRHEVFQVLLLSPEAPVVPDWGSWEVKKVANSFLSHDHYLFQVRANPTIKRVVRDTAGERKKNGRRTGIYDPEGLQAWIRRKALQAGIEILDCSAGPPIHGYFVKEGRRGKHIAVDFQGTLRVRDRAVFENTFRTGIGPAKAFGFGLLMLQPLA
jgi:CRISPR system Cascade subunit CasE